MKKKCPICNNDIKTDDIVVVLMLAKFKGLETSYELACMSQTISSHLFCVEKQVETKVVEEPK